MFPEDGSLAADWHPLLVRRLPADPELAPIFKPQGNEEFGLTGMPLAVLGRSLAGTLARDPGRVERFFVELFEEFDQVRGTPMASDYARALPALEANLPADLWQRHLGAIDPTPVDLSVQRLSMSPPGPWRHELRISVDASDAVAEKEEANNEHRRSFRVRLRAARRGR